MKNSKRSKWKTFFMILLNTCLFLTVLGAIYWGISVYYHLNTQLYTNDAQVEGFINPVNTRIGGYITAVRFNEHQPVKKGDTLVIIDNREYKIQVEQAEAAYLSALAAKKVTAFSVLTVNSNLHTSDATITASKARLWNAEQNLIRFQNLLNDGAATGQQYDQVKTDYDAIAAQTNALIRQKATVGLSTNETSRRIDVNEADIKRAHASLDLAKLNLSYTVIVAPYDGFTGRKNIQEGQLVQPGQILLSFVQRNSKWVVANYKETEVKKLYVGKKMVLTVDGLESSIIYGKVEAISQATGARYSAIPVDNSTGNFIKVQQRVPVKISFDTVLTRKETLQKLIAGMNVEVRTAD